MTKENLILNLKFMDIFCDFDISFHRYGKSRNHLKKALLELKIFKSYNLIKKLYNKNINKKCKIYGDIPKIIHQIWIGNPMPKILYPIIEPWKEIEGWEYKFWKEDDILKLKFRNKNLFKHAKNLGEKSDIARYAILEEFGGLYVDCDFQLYDLVKLEFFLDLYDIILGFEPIEHDLKLGNAFIASSKNHPCIKKINTRLQGSYFDKELSSIVNNVITKTGPAFISRIIFENLNLLKGGILLPPTYLYPFSCLAKEELKFLENPNDYIKDETFAIHYWTQLWGNLKHPYIEIPKKI